VHRMGVVGLGVMGRRHLEAVVASHRWEAAWAADRDPDARAAAQLLLPGLPIEDDAVAAMDTGDLDAVLVATSADARPALVRAALARGLHVLAEKPLAGTVADEVALLADIEATDRVVGVNLFNRSTPYHRALVELVHDGDLGELLSVDVAHLTPDLLPTEGHLAEGPPFHDCGMHYVDLACWYSGSPIATWHAQGLRIWDWPDPWWVDVHGAFADGALFHLAQTFAYGQGAAQITARHEVEITGTHGVVRLQHDFRTVTADLDTKRGTGRWTWPYGGKKLDVLLEDFAATIEGQDTPLPSVQAAVDASRLAQEMVDAARSDAPVVGREHDLEAALAHKAALRRRRAAFPEGVLEPPESAAAILPQPPAEPSAGVEAGVRSEAAADRAFEAG
jgi:predicted dehydrogenase